MKIKNLLENDEILYLYNEARLSVKNDIELATDSRNLSGKNVFIALAGENFDAYSFKEEICKSSIEVFIFEDKESRKLEMKEFSKLHENITFIGVKDALKYLQVSAASWVRKWQTSGGQVLSLTGSNGKTTTKEILFQFAKSIFSDAVLCTNGNLNNHIGVPLTIFRIKESHQFAIVEMGTNHPGEIELLCQIANPDFGLITNIGAAHLEFFKNERGVFQEKTALLRYILKYGKKFFINTNDLLLNEITKDTKNIRYTKNDLVLTNKNIRESYNIHNLNFAYFTMLNIFPEKIKELKEAYISIKLPENKRSQWIEKSEKLIFLDAYNANPSSMRAAIESFLSDSRIKLDEAILFCGDMNELGEDVARFHQEIGELLKNHRAKNVVFVGRFSEYYNLGYGPGAVCYKEKTDLEKNYKTLINNHKFIFIKASRSLQLESLLDIS